MVFLSLLFPRRDYLRRKGLWNRRKAARKETRSLKHVSGSGWFCLHDDSESCWLCCLSLYIPRRNRHHVCTCTVCPITNSHIVHSVLRCNGKKRKNTSIHLFVHARIRDYGADSKFRMQPGPCNLEDTLSLRQTYLFPTQFQRLTLACTWQNPWGDERPLAFVKPFPPLFFSHSLEPNAFSVSPLSGFLTYLQSAARA